MTLYFFASRAIPSTFISNGVKMLHEKSKLTLGLSTTQKFVVPLVPLTSAGPERGRQLLMCMPLTCEPSMPRPLTCEPSTQSASQKIRRLRR
jgi:hypothetical protein